MKGMDIFCASQAATTICLSNMDHEDLQGSSCSSSSPRAIHLGGQAIDRYNPIIRDPRRLGRTIPSYCSSQSHPEPISPKPLLHRHQNHQNIKKNSSTVLKHSSPAQKNDGSPTIATTTKKKKKKKDISQSSFLDVTKPAIARHEEKRKSSGANAANDELSNSNFAASTRKIWSPASSSRYLLSSDHNQAAFFNVISDFDPVLKLQPAVEVEEPSTKSHPPATSPPKHESPAREIKPSSSSRRLDQVVVLRVSLHCRGCERKMRKHISRMEGVSSFNIDFAAKKVTVVGNVTPLGVLASISKVKNAKLWTPAAAPLTQPNNSSDITGNNLNQPAAIVSS